MHTRETTKPNSKPWRLLLWAALAGILFGVLGLGEIAEDALRTMRNTLHMHKASGDIVLVKIDNQSVRKIGRWPWPRRYHAQLVDKLTAAGAKRIFFDIQFYSHTNPADDQAFADSVERSGRVVLPVNGSVHEGDPSLDQPPLSMFTENAHLAAISWTYNYQNAVWRLPYSLQSKGPPVTGLGAMLANRSGAPDSYYMVDYSVDPESIPTISASAIIDGAFDPATVAGKEVVIGITSNSLGDVYFIPGFRQAGGVYVHVIGAETLKSGTPVELGWIPGLLLAFLVCAAAAYRARPGQQIAVLGGTSLVLLLGTTVTDLNLVFFDVVPGLLVIVATSAGLAWSSYRHRGLVDDISGLPNLNALRASREGRDQALIAARVINYPEILATIPSSTERQFIDQMVSRLSVGAPERVIYHGEGGIFAWFDDPKTPFGHHLEALFALFRNPLKVSGIAVDAAISFGVEIGSNRSLANRLNSALVAADEGAHEGLKWKYYDPETLRDASWKLSILSQLDDAIDRGEVWIAYQPKLDLGTRQIVGAEALARWTHPEKGPIAASEFTAAAEQHDRIGKLTLFMLQNAIATAAVVNERGGDFGVAVNISGKLVSDKRLVARVSTLLHRYKLDPLHLTLELTESAALIESGQALDVLAELRDLGITLSIDDYGTGLSTLEYLRRIPATEIKIDQSFVKGMAENRSDRLMVQSTIALAHSLGRRVVAEGVEDRDTLELLAGMECDVGQGFVIGRPMSLSALKRRLSADRRRAA